MTQASADGVRDVSERHRYEITVGGQVAGYASYRDHDEIRSFVHTVVEDAYTGQGVASRLIRAALDDVAALGMRIEPVCSFVADFVRRHPDYADLLAT